LEIIEATIRHGMDPAAVLEWMERFGPWISWTDVPVAA
jgi:hypothetical protein